MQAPAPPLPAHARAPAHQAICGAHAARNKACSPRNKVWRPPRQLRRSLPVPNGGSPGRDYTLFDARTGAAARACAA